MALEFSNDLIRTATKNATIHQDVRFNTGALLAINENPCRTDFHSSVPSAFTIQPYQTLWMRQFHSMLQAFTHCCSARVSLWWKIRSLAFECEFILTFISSCTAIHICSAGVINSLKVPCRHFLARFSGIASHCCDSFHFLPSECSFDSINYFDNYND